MKPFFSIITRTMPGRAQLLERCRTSVASQTFVHDTCSGSVEHLILRDEIGVGVAEAQKLMWRAHPHGEYVFVLDDDDCLSAPDVLEKLYLALTPIRPEFAVVKVRHGELGVLPLEWECPPVAGHITVSNIVVENVLWHLHRLNFTPEYAGDYSFVASLFAKHAPQWVDVQLVTVEQRRMGAVA